MSGLSIDQPDRIGEATILLIDDSEDCRIIYSTALEHAGLRVILAEDGAQGVQTAHDRRPSVVLMDIEMPVLDGFGALKALRADPLLCRTPIVAVTARASLHQRADLLGAGFDAVLFKPAEPRAVVATIRQLLEQKLPH